MAEIFPTSPFDAWRESRDSEVEAQEPNHIGIPPKLYPLSTPFVFDENHYHIAHDYNRISLTCTRNFKNDPQVPILVNWTGFIENKVRAHIINGSYEDVPLKDLRDEYIIELTRTGLSVYSDFINTRKGNPHVGDDWIIDPNLLLERMTFILGRLQYLPIISQGFSSKHPSSMHDGAFSPLMVHRPS